MLDRITLFRTTKRIVFGVGAVEKIGTEVQLLKGKKVLVVTDPGIIRAGLLEPLTNSIQAAGIPFALFDQVEPDPRIEVVELCAEKARAEGSDCLIGYGGGSSLDIAKVAAVRLTNPGAIDTLFGIDLIPNPGVPVLLVPTTAGTGSEVGRAGVLTNSETHKKKIIFHPKLMPAVTICDPALTTGMPKFITAGTGMDALAHCLEAFSSPFYHPMSQGIALEGMRLVFENLAKVYADPNDLDARAHMMSAAAMGAVAFQKGLGAIHALSHPIGAVYNTHHGTTNAVVMPMVLDFNRKAVKDRLASAAAYCGIKGGYKGFYQRILDLRQTLNIPENLTKLGVKDPDLDMLTQMALEDPSCGGNPVKMTKRNTRALFEACL